MHLISYKFFYFYGVMQIDESVLGIKHRSIGIIVQIYGRVMMATPRGQSQEHYVASRNTGAGKLAIITKMDSTIGQKYSTAVVITRA